MIPGTHQEGGEHHMHREPPPESRASIPRPVPGSTAGRAKRMDQGLGVAGSAAQTPAYSNTFP